MEAGFPPKTLTPRYPDEGLGTRLAELTRSLGSVPVKGDIDHKKAADPTFPSYEAFSRWKGSGTLTAALSRFCENRADLSDVATICSSRAASAPPARGARRDKVVEGYVYLKRYGRSGRDYKLGKTEDVRRRHAQLESMYPGELRHVHSIPTDDPNGIERYWRTVLRISVCRRKAQEVKSSGLIQKISERFAAGTINEAAQQQA